jgi:hypothetical protein
VWSLKIATNENHWRSWDIRCYVSLAGQAKSKEVLEHTKSAASRLQSVAKSGWRIRRMSADNQSLAEK